MAGEYTGVNGVARKVKAQDVGISGIARRVVKGFVGVANVARRYFQSGSNPNERTITVVANYALHSGVIANIYVNNVKMGQLVGEYYDEELSSVQISVKANVGDTLKIEVAKARRDSFNLEPPPSVAFKDVNTKSNQMYDVITATVIGSGTIKFAWYGL